MLPMPIEYRFDDLDLREEAPAAKLDHQADAQTLNTCNLSCFDTSCNPTCLC
jgi:hypothetical protein